MFDSCLNCNKHYDNVKEIHFRDKWIIKCSDCNNELTFKKYPLFVLTGPSGVGKSTVSSYIVLHYNKL